MIVRTLVRDCLYLNWALPAVALPEPEPPLRYQLHSWQGEDFVFASLLLFHQAGLRIDGLPLPRLSYPQCNLRLYVFDGEGTPSVLLRRMLVPGWVIPGVKLLSHQPATAARLDFPHPSRRGGEGEWIWRAAREGRLEVRAHPGSPQVGAGPRLGSWEETVEYILDRPRGYAQNGGGLHSVNAAHPRVPIVPVKAEVGAADLLDDLLPLADGAVWPALHSAWLCPEIPFVFELGLIPRMELVPGAVPSTAASRGAARTRRPPDGPFHGQWPAAARQGQPAGGAVLGFRPRPHGEEAGRGAASPRASRCVEPVRPPAEATHGV